MNLEEYENLKESVVDIKYILNKFAGFSTKRKYRDRKFKKYHKKGIFEKNLIPIIPSSYLAIKMLKRMIKGNTNI